jgi:hypothetical protein
MGTPLKTERWVALERPDSRVAQAVRQEEVRPLLNSVMLQGNDMHCEVEAHIASRCQGGSNVELPNTSYRAASKHSVLHKNLTRQPHRPIVTGCACVPNPAAQPQHTRARCIRYFRMCMRTPHSQ